MMATRQELDRGRDGVFQDLEWGWFCRMRELARYLWLANKSVRQLLVQQTKV